VNRRNNGALGQKPVPEIQLIHGADLDEAMGGKFDPFERTAGVDKLSHRHAEVDPKLMKGKS